MRKISLVTCLFVSNHLFSQHNVHAAVGFTGATFNDRRSVSSGFSLYVEKDIFQRENSSFSFGSNLKIGIQDRTNTGLAIPALFLLAALLDGLTGDNSGLSDVDIKADAFAEIPLTLHYNFGWGASDYSPKRMGFYLGGGMSYVVADYTDTAGTAQKSSFFGWKADLGIRFHDGLDIHLSDVIPLNSYLGQISRPAFYEITISKYFR